MHTDVFQRRSVQRTSSPQLTQVGISNTSLVGASAPCVLKSSVAVLAEAMNRGVKGLVLVAALAGAGGAGGRIISVRASVVTGCAVTAPASDADVRSCVVVVLVVHVSHRGYGYINPPPEAGVAPPAVTKPFVTFG